MKNKIIALLLTALMVLGGLPATALAEEAVDWQAEAQNSGFLAENTVKDGDYVEGEAIVCVSAPTLRSFGAEQENAAAALLEDAEPLMELTESGNDNASDGLLRSIGEAQTETLKLVRSDSMSTETLIEQLEALPNVEYAEPNYLYELAETTDYTKRQWAYNTPYGLDIEQWNTYDTEQNPTPKTDTDGTVVAVLDSGIDYHHEDLKEVMWAGGNDYPALTALGGGAYGINTAISSTDTSYDTKDPLDDHSHGSHCAGIIAAQWNGLGVSGATSGAKLMAVKAGNGAGQFASSSIINGYNYIVTAKKNNVNITAVNNSWGGQAAGKSVNSAVTEAGKAGILSIFASGNESVDCDTTSRTVSTMKDNPYVVAVNATDEAGTMAGFTNYGKRTTDVAAPGVDIFSTITNEKAPADPRSVEAKDGLKDDFNRNQVQDETGKFIYATEKDKDQEKPAEMSIDPGQGYNESNALKLSTDSMGIAFKIASRNSMEDSKPKHLGFLYKKAEGCGDGAQLLVGLVKVKQNDGTFKDLGFQIQSLNNDFNVMSINLPENTDYTNFEMTLDFVGLDGQFNTYQNLAIDIDEMILTDEVFAYGYMSGTSMATPAVTGEAAILAAAFPNDSADKLAARIIGSVNKGDGHLTETSISGGYANVKLALAEETVPVLNSATVSGDNELTIQGYFFGDNKKSVKIGDAEISESAIKTWTDTAITLTLPEGFEAGEKKIEVTSDKGSGHQYFEIGNLKNLYSRLSLPENNADNADFYNQLGASLYGLNDSLYYIEQTEDGENIKMWRYREAQSENNGWSRVSGLEGWSVNTSSVITREGKLVTLMRSTNAEFGVGVYDPDADSWNVVKVADEALKGLIAPTLVNTGKDILIVGGAKQISLVEVEIQKAIYRIDLSDQTASCKLVGELKNARTAPLAAYSADGSVYIAAGSDATGLLVDGLERIEITEEGAKASMVKEKVLPAGLRDAQDLNFVGGTIDGGMMLTGPVQTDEQDAITADTYTLRFDGDQGFVATGKIVSTSKLYNPVATAYKNGYYVLAETNNAADGMVFIKDGGVKTLEQPGDKKSDPVDPVNPVKPVNPTNNDSNKIAGSINTGIYGGSSLLAAVAVLAFIGILFGAIYYRRKRG
ncbi:S8 family serine peptidase [Eubacterium sp.]|uniref:S8 family serine peptidase n=1 Tax=Eubacterium sp. TaxID=142586 RepID=UPI0026DF6302|nr:S8 family serine peptidase [Eubacterium sp.]MDO5431973.1 S8 family serine peptidase [Eubacterium sp.]